MAMTFDDLVDKAVTRLGWQSRLTARPDDLLWHYTSLDSLKKIAESRTVKATELEKMNDSMEGKWLYHQLIRSRALSDERFMQYLKGLWRPDPPASTYDPYGRTHTFAFCLSKGRDRLSQWRAYANFGQGVAIGFDANLLASANCVRDEFAMPADHVVLARVEYDGHSQSQIIAYLQKIIPTIPTHADEAKAGKTGHAADEASAECFRIGTRSHSDV